MRHKWHAAIQGITRNRSLSERVRHFLGGLRRVTFGVIAVLLSLSGQLFILPTSPAHAADISPGYPYAKYNGPNPAGFANTWCQDSGCYYDASGTYQGWFSPTNYGYRNCTDYVAFRESRIGINVKGWGDAYQWLTSSSTHNYTHGSIPVVGAVAYWSNNNPRHGSSGHVAYVTNWDPGKRLVSTAEYNGYTDSTWPSPSGGQPNQGMYAEHTYNIDAVAGSTNDKPDAYIYVTGEPVPIPGGWWLNPPTPEDGTKALISPLSLPVSVHAQDYTNSGLNHVNITWEFEGAGSTWQSHTQTFGALTYGSDVSYNIPAPVGGWPPSILISFDVYANNGQKQLAPQGMRRICTTSAPVCSRVTVPGKGSSSGQPATSCSPGSNQVAAFTDPNYGGNCIVQGIGDYSNPDAIGLPNDSISSIKVGGGAKAMLCRDNDFSNTCEWFQTDDPDLSNNSVNTDTVSSMRVTGGAPTTGCSPSDTQVALYLDDNYGGLCILKEMGSYVDPSAIGLPNDSISSIKVGARVKAMLCRDNNLSNTCEWFDYNDDHLSNNSVGTDNVSSVQVISRGGIALCDNTGGGGECHWYGSGDTGESNYNLSDQGFDNRAESVVYTPEYAGLYHLVLYTDQNQSGALYHADNSVNDLGNPYDNNISSIKIYKHQPPTTTITSPTDGTKLPVSTSDLDLTFSGGDAGRVHVWNDSYNFNGDWQSSHIQHLSGLTPGRYYWQAQSRNIAGEGPWTDVVSFTINTPPQVLSNELTVPAGTSLTTQMQAIDAEQDSLTLTATNLPSFVTFTDNHDGTATLTATPAASASGPYTVNIQANDGSLIGEGAIVFDVTPGDSSYNGQYFDNQDLNGTPVLTRSDPTIHFDWGGDAPDPSLPADHFSARWTKTASLAAGTYSFTVTADDGVRLYVDGQTVIDQWIDQGATTYTVTKSLTAGNHTITMEYYENTGGALAYMDYYLADDGSGNYQASYWDNQDLNGTPVLTRSESTIDNDWGGGSPDPTVPVDHFSARWTKMANFDAGTYQFTATGDDGLRLFIDDQLVIDQWIDQGATTYTANKTLSAGQHLIRYEYYENTGGAVAQLSYQQATSGNELLSSAWHLTGTEAQEAYQSMDQNALQGKTTLRITYNLHGLSALGNDASAIIIDQNGWHYISLSNYGQNGQDGEQTVDIPLSDFPGLDLSSPVDGTIHTRFWNSDPYSVDILSIQLL